MTKPGDLSRGQVVGLAFPVLLILALAAALALQTLDATRSHRETVQQTLHDHAEFAAHIIGSGAWQEMERRLLYAFAPLRLWQHGEPLPEAALLGRDRAERTRCAVEGDTIPVLARVLLPNGSLEVAGHAADARISRWLRDTLIATAAIEQESETRYGHILNADAQPSVWAYSLLKDSTGTARAIYAKSSCFSSDGVPIFARAMSDRPALPPAATGGISNDSLLYVRVEDAVGRLLWSSSADADTSGAHGELAWPRLGGARIRVFLRPEMAATLVIGGVPPSRMPAAVLLLGLATCFAGYAILQMRRQQQLMRMRERFVANVSHELRTPLQQILVFTELLRMGKLRTEAEKRHSLEVVERETHRLIMLVDNVLRFSRTGQSEATLIAEPVSLDALARDTIQGFEPLARTNDAHIRLEAVRTQAMGDASAIRRVLLNLLDNAVKYGPRSQTIRVETRTEGSHAIIAVEDEGPGIAERDRAVVWEPFRRLERDEAGVVAGSGMGLAIVRDLVERMNGRVRIERGARRGARFIIELPVTDERTTARSESATHPAGQVGP